MSWSRTLKIRQQLRAQIEAGEEIALLFSDLRGFSTYTATRGDEAAFRLARLHEDVLRQRIDQYGIVVKSFGDGVMAAFERPADAFLAARALREPFPASLRVGQGGTGPDQRTGNRGRATAGRVAVCNHRHPYPAGDRLGTPR